MTHPTRAFSGSIINRFTGSKILCQRGANYCGFSNFHQVAFLRHAHVLPQTNAAEFQILSYLCLYFVHDEECLSWFSSTKIINSSQFIEIKSLDELYVYNRKKQ